MQPANIIKSNVTVDYAYNNSHAKSLQVACYHCGLNCINSLYSEAGKIFCCTGCLTVYQFLKNQGLQDFYQIEPNPGNTVFDSKIESYQYEYLDDEDLHKKILDYQYENLAVITLKLPGIHCASCIWLLENLYKIHPGVKKVHVNFLKKQARIHFDTTLIKLSDLAILLGKVGYTPDFSWKNFNKNISIKNYNELIKLGIAGFCFGNVMMLSFPEYLSNDVPQNFRRFFGIICFLFSIPVLFYSARDWFVSAFNALKTRRVTLDVPIVSGLIVLFIKSSFDVFVNGENGYFDSLCGFIFFMLLARYFQKITFDKLSFTDGILSYFPMAVTIKTNDQFHTVPFTKIKLGDDILIRSSEIIPVESILQSENGLIDYSFLSGESDPVSVNKNMIIHAGGKICGKAILAKANKPIEGYLLEQIWEDSTRNTKKFQNSMADRISPYFIFFISIVALLTFVGHIFYGNSFGHALFCFASVLIITCPCALAISAPLVYGIMQRRLAKLGFFVRNGQTLEALSEIETIIFDKTGTLTLPEKEIIPIVENFTEIQKSAVGALAFNSIHPVSKQLSRWNTIKLVVSDFEETPGHGIEGICHNLKIKVGKYEWFKKNDFIFPVINIEENSLKNLLCIAIDNEIKGVYFLQDKFRNNWQEVLCELNKKYELHLISGDQDNEKIKIEKNITNKNNIHFYFTPHDKKKYIEDLVKSQRKVAMVGDGLNDQQALQASHVGIAISESASHFSPASDIIMLGEKFEALPYFLEIAKKSSLLIKTNFCFSLFYNFFGISIAISGMLTPLIAAILMPLSSLTVVLVALIGSSIVLKPKGEV